MPRDQRPFITLHDGMPEHPKIEALSDAAFRLLVSTWCWCNRNRTNGMVAQTSWDKRGTKRARKELIDAGLADVVDGGVVMHDYLEHQRSAEEIDELSAKRREAGKKGGKAKANALASAKQELKQNAGKAVAEQEEELARDTSSKSARARATRIPDDWRPRPEDVAWQRAEHIADDLARRELPKFRDYWAGVSGERGRKVDWPATWRNWLRRAVENTPGPKPRAVGDFGPEINTWTPEDAS
jgi:hypothetical protein